MSNVTIVLFSLGIQSQNGQSTIVTLKSCQEFGAWKVTISLWADSYNNFLKKQAVRTPPLSGKVAPIFFWPPRGGDSRAPLGGNSKIRPPPSDGDGRKSGGVAPACVSCFWPRGGGQGVKGEREDHLHYLFTQTCQHT